MALADNPLRAQSSLESPATQVSSDLAERTNESASSFKSHLRAFEQRSKANNDPHPVRTSVASRKRHFGPIGRSTIGSSAISSSDAKSAELVRVRLLHALDAGSFRINGTDTLANLRVMLEERLERGNFVFQDLATKRPVASENLRVGSLKGPITIIEKGLNDLILDSTLFTSANASISRDAANFQVLWWDAISYSHRPATLHFDLRRIAVSCKGSQFMLFDANRLRLPLVFSGINGLDKGFQIVNPIKRLASRFCAQSIEQQRLICSFFCFVWRPSAIRRGLMPTPQVDLFKLENAQEPIEPRSFANLLRRHVVEMHHIITELETKLDSNLVRYCLFIFSQMFTGGGGAFNDFGGDLSPKEFEAFNKASKLANAWNDMIAKKKDSHPSAAVEEDMMSGKPGALQTGISLPFGEFLDADIDIEVSNLVGAPAISLATGSIDGVPPPPPPMPGSAMQLKPAILQVNFQGLSISDIAGTIWSEMVDSSKLDSERSKLEAILRILFGKDSRDWTPSNRPAVNGVLDSGRLRNLGVQLHMEELKGLTFDDILRLIKRFDPRLFSAAVLDRLVIKEVGKSKESTFFSTSYALLPNTSELKKLTEHLTEHGSKGLLPAELFLMDASKISYGQERFVFGHIICKVEVQLVEASEALLTIEAAIKAIRTSSKFKAALFFVLMVLTVLTPRYGLTRGFLVSSFCNSTALLFGNIGNPNYVENASSAQQSIELASNLENMDPAMRRQAKLAKLRSKEKQEEMAWKVRLVEYLAVFINRKEASKEFWLDLLEPCSMAMRVELAALNSLCDGWSLQTNAMKEWLSGMDAASFEHGDGFKSAIDSFLDSTAKRMERAIQRVRSVTKSVEEVWHWLGEKMVGEPTQIFKYVHDFCDCFRLQWISVEENWHHPRHLVLRGEMTLQRPPQATKNNEKKESVSVTSPPPSHSVRADATLLLDSTPDSATLLAPHASSAQSSPQFATSSDPTQVISPFQQSHQKEGSVESTPQIASKKSKKKLTKGKSVSSTPRPDLPAQDLGLNITSSGASSSSVSKVVELPPKSKKLKKEKKDKKSKKR